MNISSFIAGRIAFNRQHSFSRFIIRLAVAATAISVMAMILTIAFTRGFQHAIAQKMYGFSGHIRVQHYEPERVDIAEEQPIKANDSVLQALRADPDVVIAQPFATKYAIIKGPESFEGLRLKGVDRHYNFSNLQPFLQSGRWIHFPDSAYSNEIDLSTYTASELNLKPGDQLFAYFIQPDGSRRVRPLRVAGLFKTGIEDYDRINAVVDLRLIRRLNNWQSNEIGGYELFIKDYRQADSISNRIYNELPAGWNSLAISQVYGNIFDWLNLQDTTILIVIIIMILVAVLNLITCLIILVLERTHMIGLLKSLGAPDNTVQRVFLYHGAIITFGGILLGNLFGLLVCYLQQRYGFIKLPEETYFISTAAVSINTWQILLIDLGTFVICFVVLLLPSFTLIKRMSPVRALRFD
ncbi:MAG TPA: FtsX-like permease family protein [Puia sp.]|nr:FtsX-like permease family protein [Puia sp.]